MNFFTRALAFPLMFFLFIAPFPVDGLFALGSGGRTGRLKEETAHLRANPESAADNQQWIGSVAMFPWSKIVFQSYRDGNWEIYSSNDDGTDVMRLTQDASPDILPRLNRGANKIVFSSKRYGNYDVFSMNVDGSHLTKLTDNNADDVMPVWSPDGSQIAFQTYRDGHAEIYKMNADGSSQTRLTDYFAYNGEPAWSPDGSQIAFISNRAGAYNVFVMNTNGGSPTPITNGKNCGDPIWSPDGSWIAYDADYENDGWQDVWITRPNGADQHKIIASFANTDMLVGGWSPDSRLVAYTKVDYVYDQGNWYWTSGQIKAINITTLNSIFLSAQNTEWRPDWKSTDVLTPTSSITPLPAVSPGPFVVDWAGHDDGLSGIKGYDLQVKEGNQVSWSPWLTQTESLTSIYPGIGGHKYYFRIRAYDNSGNIERWREGFDAFTAVEAMPPTASTETMQRFARDTAQIRWPVEDPGGSGIQGYDVQYRSATNQTWMDWLINTQAQSASFSGPPGSTYYFRSRATDKAWNTGQWSLSDEGAAVTFYTWKDVDDIHDNAGVPIISATVNISPPLIGSKIQGSGFYTQFDFTNTSGYTISWEKSGYKPLPAMTFSTKQDKNIELVLPPTDDVIRNGSFEGLPLGEGWKTEGTATAVYTNSYFHTGESALFLGSPDSIQWNPIEKVGDAQLGVSYRGGAPKVVMDSSGTLHAMWSSDVKRDFNLQILYSQRPKNGSWSAPIQITTEYGDEPDLAIDKNDTLYAVWGGAGLAFASKPLNENWSEPITLTNLIRMNPKILVDPTGDLHVLGCNLNTLYMSRISGIWTTPESTSLSCTYSADIDSKGTLHAGYAAYINEVWQSIYLSKPKNQNWSPATQVTFAGGLIADLKVDSEDNVHIVWENPYGQPAFNYRKKPAGQDWEKAEGLVSSAVLIDHAKIVFRQGRVGAIYAELRSSIELVYAERDGRGVWSQISQFSPDDHWSVRPSLVSDLNGNLHVVWFEWLIGGDQASGEILYRSASVAERGDYARASQTLYLAPSIKSPTLSFFYWLQGGSLSAVSGLKVEIEDSSSVSTALFTGSSTSNWRFRSIDLSAWSGKNITVTFLANQSAGDPKINVLLDDVALGSSYPDVWVNAPALKVHPGDSIEYLISYGNQGGASAANVSLRAALPSGISLLSAVPFPTVIGDSLLWNVGELPAHGSTGFISVTVQVSGDLLVGRAFSQTVIVRTESDEVEDMNNSIQSPITIQPYFAVLPLVMR